MDGLLVPLNYLRPKQNSKQSRMQAIKSLITCQRDEQTIK